MLKNAPDCVEASPEVWEQVPAFYKVPQSPTDFAFLVDIRAVYIFFLESVPTFFEPSQKYATKLEWDRHPFSETFSETENIDVQR